MQTPTEISWPIESFQERYDPIRQMSAEDLAAALTDLAAAFGGHSMYRAEEAGRAIAGRIVNNGGAAPSFDALAAWHHDRWGDVQAWEEGDDEVWAREVIAAANARLAEAADPL